MYSILLKNIFQTQFSILLVLTIYLQTGCAQNTTQIPIATNYPYSRQHKMQAAHHLEILSQEVAEEFRAKSCVSKETPLAVAPKFLIDINQHSKPLSENNPLETGRYTDGWIVKSPLENQFYADWLKTLDFKRAYQNYLTKELLDAGYTVVDTEAKAETFIVFDIHLFEHSKKREVRAPKISDQFKRLFAGGLDGAYRGIEPGNYEAIITTSVQKDNQYLMSHIGTFYINPPKPETPPARWAF